MAALIRLNQAQTFRKLAENKDDGYLEGYFQSSQNFVDDIDKKIGPLFTSLPLLQDSSVHSDCAVQWNGKYVRGVALPSVINEALVDVFLVDFGITENYSPSNLRVLPDSVRNYPRLGLRLYLSEPCENRVLDGQSICVELTRRVDDFSYRGCIVKNDGNQITLNESQRMNTAKSDGAPSQPMPPKPEPVVFRPLAESAHNLSYGKSVHIMECQVEFALSGGRELLCVHHIFRAKLLEVIDSLEKLPEPIPAEKVYVKLIVMVLSKGSLLRGIVNRIIEKADEKTKYHVIFIDTIGSTETSCVLRCPENVLKAAPAILFKVILKSRVHQKLLEKGTINTLIYDRIDNNRVYGNFVKIP